MVLGSSFSFRIASLLSMVVFVNAQWSDYQEFYYENREYGEQVYYSESIYTEYDPNTENYQEYTYNEQYGKDYFWKNYDNDVYTERQFISKYGEINYYASKDDGLKRWSYQISTLLALSLTCCIIVSVCACCLSCILKR